MKCIIVLGEDINHGIKGMVASGIEPFTTVVGTDELRNSITTVGIVDVGRHLLENPKHDTKCISPPSRFETGTVAFDNFEKYRQTPRSNVKFAAAL